MDLVESNHQIKTIYTTSAKKEFKQLVTQFYKKQDEDAEAFIKDIDKMVSSNKTDKDIYQFIESKLSENYDPNLGERASSKTSDLISLLPSIKLKNIKGKGKIIDIGCKDGSILTSFAQKLDIPKNHLYGYDVADDKKLDQYIDNFTYYGPKDSKYKTAGVYNGYNVEQENVDIAIALAVLHHVEPKDLEPLLKNIFKSLRSGGFFIIREHDVKKHNQQLIPVIDVEHVLYVVLGKEDTLDNFIEHNPKHTGYFKSEHEWDDILSKVGFERIKNLTVSKRLDQVSNYRTHMYYAIYIKP